MIDFPASPTTGQLYIAPNGVTYQWNGTLWLTNSAGGTGQVQATGGNFVPSTGVDVVIAFGTIASGNAGNWLSTVTGRYTPPAGRYFLQCTNGVQAPAGGNGTWTLAPRKNGVRIPSTGAQGSGSQQFSVPLTVGVYVDANGTDYFDFVANCAAAGMAAQGGQFTAFPLSGMQGPPGPSGPAGDFWAYNSANLTPAANVVTVLIANTVGTGNGSGAYNPTTGRYTPPAGRYFIFGTCVAAASGAAMQFTVYLRKNGVNIPGAVSWETPATSNYYSTAKIGVLVDANGTDYFDLTINPNAAGTTVTVLNLGAIPTTGVGGPPGPAGPLAIGTGVVVDFAGSVAPIGWYLCDGALKNRTTDSALFAVIGTTYGAGDGSTTFAVPDLRGRVTAGPDPTNLRLGSARPGGFPANGAVLGAVGGEGAHTLTTAEQAPTGTRWYNIDAQGPGTTAAAGGGTNLWYTDLPYGGQGHNNTQPTAIMNKIIKA